MARKIQRSFGAELSQKKNEKEVQEQNEQKETGPIALEGTNAPLWRQVIAYAIDASLSLGVMWMFMFFGQQVATTTTMSLLYVVSNLLTQIWFFVLWPTDYSRGQTIGKKLMQIYTRDVETKKVLSWWKGLLRDFVYGVLLFLFTIPLEIFFAIIQFVQKPTEEKYPMQTYTLFGRELKLSRDILFKSETVYMVKPKKVKKSKAEKTTSEKA